MVKFIKKKTILCLVEIFLIINVFEFMDLDEVANPASRDNLAFRMAAK